MTHPHNPDKSIFVTDGQVLICLDGTLSGAFRREHPGCGFVHRSGGQGRATVLHTPVGRLTCRWDTQGNITRSYVQKPRDVEILNEFLRAAEYYSSSESAIMLAGPSPVCELVSLWAHDTYSEIEAKASASLASVQRKQYRHVHRKAQAVQEFCKLLIFQDDLTPAAEPIFDKLLEGYAALCRTCELPFLITVTPQAMALWQGDRAKICVDAMRNKLHNILRFQDETAFLGDIPLGKIARD